jgi:hypothetical protein
MGKCYENQRGGSYCVSDEVADQGPAPGYAAPSNAAAQDAMWQDRRLEILAQWNQFDSDVQWQAVQRYDRDAGVSLETGFFADRLPHPQIMWEWVSIAEDVQATDSMWAANDARHVSAEARAMYASAERITLLGASRVEAAKGRWSHYAHQANGTSFWGWVEAKWAEHYGQVEMPDLAIEQHALASIERALAFIAAGSVEQVEQLEERLQAMEDKVNIWIETMNVYIQGREAGGDMSVEKLQAVETWSKTFVATGLAPALGVEAVLGRALISGGVAAGFELVDQGAAVQADIREGMSGSDLLSAFLISGAGTFFAGKMGPKILGGLDEKIGAEIASRTGRAWAGPLVKDAIKRSLSVPLKSGFVAALDSLSGRREVRSEDIVEAIYIKLGAKLSYTVGEALLAGG